VFTNKKPVRALRDQLKYDALYPDPLKLTTLTNNHDTPRFMSLSGATLEGAMLHTAFMLTVRGIPQLYFGEEIAMEGKDDPDNRRDFPGGFPGDPRSAFRRKDERRTNRGCLTGRMIGSELRREHAALRDGRLIDLYYDDDAYAFARKDSGETVIVVVNRAAEKTMRISAGSTGLREGKMLLPLYGTSGGVTARQGELVLTVPAKTAVAYKVG
jgi:glycosidase